MSRKLLKQKYTILGISLSIIFIYLAFREIDIRALGIRLKTADLTYVFLTFLPLSVSYIARTFLWRRVISNFREVNFSNAFSALMIGFFANNILLGRIGEFVRAYVLGNKENLEKTFILGTIVIERLSDIFTLLLLLVLSTFMFPIPIWAKHMVLTTVVVFLIILAVAYLVLLKRNPFLEKLENKLFFLSNPKRQFVITNLGSFISGLEILKKPRFILTVFTLSLLIWLFVSISVFFTLKSVNINIPNYGVLFVLSAVSLGLIIPSSPGYLGTYQFLCVVALSTFSVSKEAALSFSIIHHVSWYLPSTLLGLVFLWKENLNLAKLRTIKEIGRG
ncbi:MAG: lysylphosphatidylglycerol synthase transmembrane domain-containing protein [Ignavibacteriales bacterium]